MKNSVFISEKNNLVADISAVHEDPAIYRLFHQMGQTLYRSNKISRHNNLSKMRKARGD